MGEPIVKSLSLPSGGSLSDLAGKVKYLNITTEFKVRAGTYPVGSKISDCCITATGSYGLSTKDAQTLENILTNQNNLVLLNVLPPVGYLDYTFIGYLQTEYNQVRIYMLTNIDVDCSEDATILYASCKLQYLDLN